MKKIITAIFIGFIAFLFLGTSAKFAKEAIVYAKEDGLKSGVLHIWNVVYTIENSYQENLIGHDSMININGAFNRATFVNGVSAIDKTKYIYRLKNDYIAFVVHKFEEFNEEQRNSIDLTVKAAKEIGSEVLFVSIPPKVCKEEDFVLRGIINPEYQINNYRLGYFDGIGIETLNLHEKLHDQELDHYSLFYRTDHHWNADAGLWASTEISKWLSGKGFNVDLSTFSKENYEEKIIEDLFLGSQGKHVGIYYAGVDDFKYFVPEFETNYTFSINEESAVTGTFEETVFKKDQLTKNYLHSFNYSSFLGGDFALTKIVNNINADGPKILMLKDSFTNAFSVYLAAECSELHLIDPRSHEGSVSEYIKENNFDAVIITVSGFEKNNAFIWED